MNGRFFAVAFGACLALGAVAGCRGDAVVSAAADGADATSDDDRGDVSLDAQSGADATLDDGIAREADGPDDVELDGASAGDAGADVDATSSDAGGDSGSADAEADARACTPPLASCTLPSGYGDGLCSSNGYCAFCHDVTDDKNCSLAYADGGSNGYICTGSTCVPGDCHNAADCASGFVCGATKPHYCGPCTADWQCQNDVRYGASYMCDTISGICVPNSCSTNDAPCSNNPADVCCGDSCVYGNCCSDSNCPRATPACDLHGCSACSSIGNTTYVNIYVDPVNGVDAAGNGSGRSIHGDLHPVCAFKTMSFALAQLGPNPPNSVSIWILGGTLSQASGETFPLRIPSNVTVQTAPGFPTATIAVTPGADGFVMTGNNSGVQEVAVDGQGNANRGFVALSGSSIINGITVQNFAGPGIEVAGTASAILEFVSSTHNGTSTHPAAGLFVHGSGRATLAMDSPVSLSQNTGNGLLVEENGSVQISAQPKTLGQGDVVVNQNTGDGVVFSPSTSTSGAKPPQSSISGVVVWQSGGNGFVIEGGSNVKVRGSYVLANTGDGIEVLTNPDDCGGQSGCSDNDISTIDLGNEMNTDWGVNTVQDATNPNKGVGICLSLDVAASGSLLAEGNFFSSTIDCRGANFALSKNQCDAGSTADVGVAGITTNTIDTLSCSN